MNSRKAAQVAGRQLFTPESAALCQQLPICTIRKFDTMI
jgi:hypothetical protein